MHENKQILQKSVESSPKDQTHAYRCLRFQIETMEQSQGMSQEVLQATVQGLGVVIQTQAINSRRRTKITMPSQAHQ